MRVRILVYNVKAFRLGVRNVATLVAEHAPDVALLQECGPRYRLRRFSRAVGMEPVSKHFLFHRSIHDAVLVRRPWRVISHDLHHGGELAVTLGMQGIALPELGDEGGHLSERAPLA